MRLKKTLLAALSVLTLGAAIPALAGEPHVDIRLVFGIPGVYVAPPPPPVVVYPAPRPPVVVVQDYPHYHPRIAYYGGRYYEGQHLRQIKHRHVRDSQQHRHRNDDRWDRRGR